MTFTDQKSCLTCAWRETCQKRFASTEDLGLRCPEYTLDVRLKKQHEQAGPEVTGTSEQRKGGAHT